MAEEAQELTVTNTGQPLTVDLLPAETTAEAQEMYPSIPAAVTVSIEPAAD